MTASYENTVFLGIDVHKKTYSVSAVQSGTVLRRATLEADPVNLINFCKKFFPGCKVKSAYEAGFCGFHIHRTLIAAGVDNVVVHAAGIEMAAGNRVKTDKRDSFKIATQLAVGRLKGIFIPSPERESYRSISRLREEFVKNRSRVANQIKSHLYLLGLIPADSRRRVSKSWLKEISKLKCSSDHKYCLVMRSKLWLDLSDSIKKIEARLENQSVKEKALEAIYCSLPGIGSTAARLLINELGDLSQFSSENKLFSYCGLTPSENSSGEHQRQGHITRQGKAILRKTLVQAAWVAIRHDSSLNEIYTRVSKSAGPKRSIIAVARKMIGRIRCCIKENRMYVVAKPGGVIE